MHYVAHMKQKNIDAIEVSSFHLFVAPHLWKCLLYFREDFGMEIKG
jgi:hypothetical protein